MKRKYDYALSTWDETINENQHSNPISVPSHYKRNKVEEKKIMVTKT